MGSLFFAVLLAIVMFALLEGVYGNMIRNMAGFTTGYRQVHGNGYWEEKDLDLAIPVDEALIDKLDQTKGITGVAPASKVLRWHPPARYPLLSCSWASILSGKMRSTTCRPEPEKENYLLRMTSPPPSVKDLPQTFSVSGRYLAFTRTRLSRRISLWQVSHRSHHR